MEIIYTFHASKRMLERGINEKQIEQILSNPDSLEENKVFIASKRIIDRTIKIIYNLQRSKKRKLCLWIGASVIVLMGLFPPVKIGRSSQYVEYSFILNPSGPILLSNLIVQWIIVLVITGGLIYRFRDKNKKIIK